MVRRYAAGAAAGAALVVSLAACQGDGDGKTAQNVSAAQAIDMASQKTSDVSSYKVDLTASGTGSVASKLHGVLQVRTTPDVAATATLDAASFHGASMSGSERAILLNDNLYAKVPDQLSSLTGGKQWVKFALSDAERGTGLNVDEMLKQADPAAQTKFFTSSKDVKRVGTQSINGDKTTHYRGSATPEDAAAGMTGKARQSFQEFYKKAGAKSVTFDLWVGSDNLPRKLVTKATATKGTIGATMIYSGYNKSFNVSAPPAGETADGAGLASMFGH